MQSKQAQKSYRIAPWKWVCGLILIYVFIAGWLIPLNPGIIGVTPDRTKAGQRIDLHITGYNSSYTTTKGGANAWLRLKGDTVLQAEKVIATDDRHLTATFYLPSVFPMRQEAYALSLIVDHGAEGSSILPNALSVLPASNPDSSEMNMWYAGKIHDVTQKPGIQFPYRNILAETIRNTYFHVPMWFCMIVLFGASAWYSLRYYRKGDMDDDRRSMAYIWVGFLFGMLGLVTGMLWAKNTWGQYWSWDVKQNMSAISLLIYAALMVMRSSIEDDMQRARLTAGYNMFAFVLLIPLLFIVPRMTDSLHPGNGGNPAFGGEDLDNTMRLVFYPAVIGFIMLGLWISQLRYRYERLKQDV